ncbi:MAG: hypothetical protein HC880_21535, partial [Bacteroidia bacterium]|nr:hypothetical protein [Bacteroidia bacterium]
MPPPPEWRHQKIARDNNVPTSVGIRIQNRNLPANYAWEVVWEEGTTEGGSSGG